MPFVENGRQVFKTDRGIRIPVVANSFLMRRFHMLYGRSIRLHAAALLDRDRASPGRKNRWRPGVAFSSGLSNITYPGTGNSLEP